VSEGSAVAKVERALQLAHATQDTVNAFISIDDERALDRAAEIDRRLAAGEEVGPLAGVPVALKDLIDHEGRVTTCGSFFYSKLATTTAPCVAGLEAAGAVIIGRTNLHEWAFGFNSENARWGPVRNPWDLATSAGGSSGGSGAAVAAGITPVAIGTDTGGSVRVPAALCGAFGLKVTYGRVPLDGVFPLVPSIDTVGPLADSMAGIETSYRAMSGDTTPVPARASFRIGVPEPWCETAPMDSAIADSFQWALDALRDLGHVVHPITMPDAVPARQLLDAIGQEVSAAHKEFRSRGERYGPAVESRIEVAESVSPEATRQAREWQEMIRHRFTDAFATVDFLVTPTTPVRRKVIGEDMIGAKSHRTVLSYFSALVNHALVPALALPLTGPGSPPASLQVIGASGSEASLIGLGIWLETAGVATFRSPGPNTPTAGGE
jgi:Asp-tRNA(Asn)/Glu-tRNA(Gln) amidotransferase A subunit family amidase